MTSPDSPLQFPCDFPVKVMGYASAEFEQTVIEIVQRHASDVDTAAVQVRSSRQARYASVTVVVRAESRDQLDALYRELHACEQVVMLL